MNIVLAGASGLIGTALAGALEGRGDEVIRLVRRRPQNDGEVEWNPDEKALDTAVIDYADAVVCLSGKSIADKRWTSAVKQEILSSRVNTAGLLAETIANAQNPPSVFVCASAVGIYGTDDGSVGHDETSATGSDFLSDICQQWEYACHPARNFTRVVHARLGVVLSKDGGALQKMLPAFRMGLGGPLGSGDQVMSWIALEDAVTALIHAIDHAPLEGPVNFVAPGALSNTAFSQSLAAALDRPCIFRAPGFVIRAALGEMGETLLLKGARVIPAKLEESGFQFRYSEIDSYWSELVA